MLPEARSDLQRDDSTRFVPIVEKARERLQAMGSAEVHKLSRLDLKADELDLARQCADLLSPQRPGLKERLRPWMVAVNGLLTVVLLVAIALAGILVGEHQSHSRNVELSNRMLSGFLGDVMGLTPRLASEDGRLDVDAFLDLARDRSSAYAGTNPAYMDILLTLARLNLRLERFDSAEELASRASRLAQDALLARRPKLIDATMIWATARLEHGDLVTAESAYSGLVEELRDAHLIDSPAFAEALYGLGQSQLRQNKAAVAKRHCERATDLRRRYLGIDHGLVGEALLCMGEANRLLGETRLAQDLLSKALEINQRFFGAMSSETARARQGLGRLFLDQGHLQDAQSELAQAHAIVRDGVQSQSMLEGAILVDLARVAHGRQRVGDGLELISQAERCLGPVLESSSHWIRNELDRVRGLLMAAEAPVQGSGEGDAPLGKLLKRLPRGGHESRSGVAGEDGTRS